MAGPPWIITLKAEIDLEADSIKDRLRAIRELSESDRFLDLPEDVQDKIIDREVAPVLESISDSLDRESRASEILLRTFMLEIGKASKKEKIGIDIEPDDEGDQEV